MTIHSMKANILRTVVAGLLSLTLAACAMQTGGPGKPSGPSAALVDLPAESFWAPQRVDLPIEAQKVDHELLCAALFHETNLRRRQTGRPPLARAPRLDAAARMQAADMAQYGFLSHTNPHRPGGRTPGERAQLAGFQFRFLAENVATHFAIQYQSGKTVYRVQTGTGYSYRPNGPPISRHTYRSFASTLLDQWMNSPGHRRNILSDQPRQFGSDCRLEREKNGLDQFYCVQVFGSAEEKN